jgi:nucleoside-diphosphate-sugar epimerase
MAIFITGATGFIGGAIAAKLVERGIEVRGLVRDEGKAKQLAELGIVPVLGNLDDSVLLIKEARASEGVINTADSDHRKAVEAIIQGLEGSNKPLLHTSGTGLFADNAQGEYATEQIYDDMTPFKLEADDFSDRAEIDQMVRDAADLGIRSAVLCNTNIYGWGKGVHPESIQVPWLIREAKKHNEASYIGKGASIWSNVHIDDLADLYLLAYVKATAGSFYFVENGEASFLDTAKAIAKRFNLPGPNSWTVEEATEKAGQIYAFLFGSNSRVRAIRARTELGWQPKHASLTDWIEQEA